MRFKFIAIVAFIAISSQFLSAQKLEHMLPAGYQNPFLKSGQFITTLYYYSLLFEDDFNQEDPPYVRNHGENSIRFAGYLGLTGQIT